MTEMRASVPDVEPIATNSILVALQDTPLVIRTLRDRLGIGVEEPGPGDESPLLGLRRMTLLPPSLMSAEGRALVSRAAEHLQRQLFDNEDEFVIDAVLAWLRWHFRTEYAGWMPVMGKNRLLDQRIAGDVIIRENDSPPRSVPAPGWAARRLDRNGPGAGVRVGLLDTPFAPHPWLTDGVDDETSVLLTPDEPNWRGGHATSLAGLILQQAPGATVVPITALNDRGIATSWDFANRLADIGAANSTAAPADRIRIINVSSGTFTRDGREPLAINRALATLGPDVVVVAAAGNHGADSRTEREGLPFAWSKRPLYPSAAAPVIAVGSADADGIRSDFSPDVPWVDVLAPGEGVVSTYLYGLIGGFKAYPTGSAPGPEQDAGDPPDGTTREYHGFAARSGTSFATALVSGAIAARTRWDGSARMGWERLRRELRPNGYLALSGLVFET